MIQRHKQAQCFLSGGIKFRSNWKIEYVHISTIIKHNLKKDQICTERLDRKKNAYTILFLCKMLIYFIIKVIHSLCRKFRKYRKEKKNSTFIPTLQRYPL